jgi:hypothetical protein
VSYGAGGGFSCQWLIAFQQNFADLLQNWLTGWVPELV